MRRVRLGLLAVLVLILLLAAAAALVVRGYLSSGRVAERVTAGLEEQYGASVRVGKVEVGLNASSVKHLELFEEGAAPGAAPWATFENVRADVALTSLLRGSTQPRDLDVTGAALRLRFDKDGHLLTRLPARKGKAVSLPDVHLHRSRVTIDQEGRPEFIVDGIDAEVHSREGKLVLAGTVQDPRWGNWDVDGSLDPAGGPSSGTLKTAGVHVTQKMLEDLPFVSPGVWQQVRAEGDTPVEFTLSYEPDKRKVHYRVALEPQDTTVHVKSIDLSADRARGKVMIEDAVVRLEKVQGHTADGTISTDAVLDFCSTPNRFTFTVRAEGLDLVQLPKKWKLPSQLEGRLSGHAELVVTIRAGKVQTSGEGQGEITDARVLGFKSRPIQLRLFSDDEGIHFSRPQTPDGTGPGARLPAGAALAVALLAAPPAAEGQSAPESSTPGRAAARLGTAALDVAGGIAETGRKLLSSVPRRSLILSSAEKPKGQAPAYLEANLALDDVDLQKLVEQLNLKVPFTITGRASVHVQVAFPLDTPQDIKTYRVRGSAESRRLVLAGVELEQLKARIDYRDGVLRLENLTGEVPAAKPTDTGRTAPGAFRGSARLEVAPVGKLTAGLTLDRIPLSQVLEAVPGPAPAAEGTVSGALDARVPADRLKDVSAWKVSGGLNGRRLRAYGWTLEDAAADVLVDQGVLELPSVSGRLEGAPVSGSARLDLDRPYRYHARLGVKKYDLGTVQRLVPEFRPPFSITGNSDASAELRGTLSPLTWEASGGVAAQELVVAGVRAGNVKFNWAAGADRVDVTDLQARLYRGEVTGSAEVPVSLRRPPEGSADRPREGAKAEPGRVNLKFTDLDVGAFLEDLFNATAARGEERPRGRAAFPIQGQADGTVTATLPASRAEKGQDISAKVTLTSPKMFVLLGGQRVPTRRVQGSISYRDGTFDYRLESELAGGTMELNGQVPSRPRKPADQPPPEPSRPPEVWRDGGVVLVRQAPAAAPAGEGGGRLRIRGAQLSRLWQELGIDPGRVPLRGTVDLDLPFRQESIDQLPRGTGELVIRRLRWDRTDLTGEVRSAVRLTERELRFTDVSGVVGQGVVRGGAAFPLRRGGRGWFNFALDDIESSRLLAPWPDLAERVEGPLDVTVRGSLDGEWSGSAVLTLVRGRVLGVEVSDWRVPVDFIYAPSRNYGQARVQDTTAMIALGRVTGRGEVDWDSVNRLDGTVRFSGVDLATLLRQSGDLGEVGAGKASGRVELNANDLRSLNDLSGVIDASFQQAQPRGFPVFRQIMPFLGVGQSSSFTSGDLRARLDRGVIRVQRLTLTGTNLRLFAEGTVSLEGRLSLEVTALTGQVGVNPRFLRLLGLRIPAFGPIPVALLLEASTYLANRTVHLRVTGTIRNPTIQVEPVSLLSDTAVRYFINQSSLPLLP
jgi:translocation and assembly module TamB